MHPPPESLNWLRAQTQPTSIFVSHPTFVFDYASEQKLYWALLQPIHAPTVRTPNFVFTTGTKKKLYWAHSEAH